MGVDAFVYGVWLWLFGMVPMAPVMFFLGRFGRGELIERKSRAAARTAFWPATILFALANVIFFLLSTAQQVGALGLSKLITTPRDVQRAQIMQAERDVLTARQQADVAEKARDEADFQLAEFSRSVELEHELGTEDPDVVAKVLAAEQDDLKVLPRNEQVTGAQGTIPHGRVHYAERSLAVRGKYGKSGEGIKRLEDLPDSTLVWRCEKTGYWHTAWSMKDVPAGCPVWQVDRKKTAARPLNHHIILRFWGHNTETGLPESITG